MEPFEDHYGDVLAKARFGLGLTPAEAGRRAGVSAAVVTALERGDPRPDEAAMRALARVLALSAVKLTFFARAPEPPRPPVPPLPFQRIRVDEGIAMNAYAIADGPRGGAAAVVDPGGDLPAIAAALDRIDARAAVILLTHAHGDHVGALRPAASLWSVPVLALPGERKRLGELARLVTFTRPGARHAAGRTRIRVLRVPGHTAGMAVFHLAEAGVAFTGDALFARSLGRSEAPGRVYRAFLDAVRDRVLSLPPETILCPGHGPLTTVADELQSNPFFP